MLILGDCLTELKKLPENTIDAVITDPPYELGFMGKSWDNTGIAYKIALWKEVLRVLKPGGHLLSFGGSRTYHRMTCAIEDAGFEIRDQIMWVYGSGFPKSLNIGKAVDKLQGNEREVVGQSRNGSNSLMGGLSGTITTTIQNITKGTSEWEGWGTALKPAHEPICMARKPLAEKTVAENCLKWGVGGLAIDECRVEIPENDKDNYNFNNNGLSRMKRPEGDKLGQFDGGWKIDKTPRKNSQGRFPANLIHDGSDEVVELFPNTKAGVAVRHNSGGNTFGGNNPKPPMKDIGYGDNGSAARFFYCAKASSKERNEGLEDFSNKESKKFDGGEFKSASTVATERKSKNHHPTVKPILLMKYLVKLISREGQTVLDPFMGSGTTGIACKELNRNFIGIEMNGEYMEIAKKRIG